MLHLHIHLKAHMKRESPYRGIHYARSVIIDNDLDKHYKLDKIPPELVSCVSQVLSLEESVLSVEDLKARICSLSVMSFSREVVIGPHVDQDWVSSKTKPFDVFNCSDKEYSVVFTRIKAPTRVITITVPPWSRYRVEGELRRKWQHAVSTTHQRLAMRIGWMMPVCLSLSLLSLSLSLVLLPFSFFCSSSTSLSLFVCLSAFFLSRFTCSSLIQCVMSCIW